MSQNQPTLEYGSQAGSDCGCSDVPSAQAPQFAQGAQAGSGNNYGFLYGGPSGEGVELMTRQAAPTLPASAGSAVAAISTWQNDKRVNAMWVINEDRNAWMGVVGVGWKKLSNASESATSALTLLTAHARTKDSPVNYREEADGMVHEIYVW